MEEFFGVTVFTAIVVAVVVGGGGALITLGGEGARQQKLTDCQPTKMVSRNFSGWTENETWRCADGSTLTLTAQTAAQRWIVRTWDEATR